MTFYTNQSLVYNPSNYPSLPKVVGYGWPVRDHSQTTLSRRGS